MLWVAFYPCYLIHVVSVVFLYHVVWEWQNVIVDRVFSLRTHCLGPEDPFISEFLGFGYPLSLDILFVRISSAVLRFFGSKRPLGSGVLYCSLCLPHLSTGVLSLSCVYFVVVFFFCFTWPMRNLCMGVLVVHMCSLCSLCTGVKLFRLWCLPSGPPRPH